MIRVVLDANVYVSAVLKPSSNPGQIIDLVRRNAIHLLVSPDIPSEVKAVLLYPRLLKLHHRSPKWIRAYVRELSDLAEMIPGDVEVNAIKDDPSDNIYLACAVEGKADLIVSGDRHLKDLKSFRQIPIVDPAKFLQEISKGGRN
jgi:putative PIN family toxin of toxin-antitoxin system